jgi:hypothetical protein
MSDRMPEDMPDKMPENISDKMSENLPIRNWIFSYYICFINYCILFFIK